VRNDGIGYIVGTVLNRCCSHFNETADYEQVLKIRLIDALDYV
jgi:hypothetical protein